MKADAAKFVRFLQTPDQLKIPIYQRVYSWTRDECEQLVVDIERIATTPGVSAHFIGSIVYVAESQYTVTSATAVQVIDGQQRLTTLTLLLVAIAEVLRESGPEDKTARKIMNQLLTRPDESGVDRYKLALTQRDRDTLFAIVDGRQPPPEPSPALVRNFEFLRDRVRRSLLTPDELFSGVDRLMIVDISLTRGEDDPQLIFESLNSTGVDLSQADLIRNYLLMGLVDSEQERIYRESWHPIERALAGAEDDSVFDRFMRDYLTLKTGRIDRLDRIYAAFKTLVGASGKTDADAVAADLLRFARYYRRLLHPEESAGAIRAALADLARLKVDVAFPFLLDALDDHAEGRLSEADLGTVLRLVETYFLRRAVVGVPQAALNKIFAVLAREVDEERYIESLSAALLLREGTARIPTDEEFAAQFAIRDMYSFRARSYVFDKLENHARKEHVDVDRYTIEHIMPQNPDISDAWRDELGPDWEHVQRTYLHTIGNLTLTGYNSELSDRPFAAKQSMEGGFRDSPIRMNRTLANAPHWNEATIRDRADVLAERALEIWPLPPIAPDTLATYRQSRATTRTTYTRADHQALRGPVGPLFEELARRIVNLDPEIHEEPRKQYIAFRNARTVASVVPLANELKIYLPGKIEDFEASPIPLRDVASLGHWGLGDVEVRVATPTDIDEFMPLVGHVIDHQADAADEMPTLWSPSAVERAIEQFEPADLQSALWRLVAEAEGLGLVPRAYTRSLALVPVANRNRTVISITPRDNDAQLWVAAEAFEQFFPISASEVSRLIGPNGPTTVGAPEIIALIDGLDELLGAVPVSTATAEPERHVVRRQFWAQLLEAAADVTPLHRGISAGYATWVAAGAGRYGLSWLYRVTQHGWRVEFYVDRGAERGGETAAIFEALRSHAAEIEARFGSPLDWSREEGRRGCQVGSGGDGGYRDDDWAATHAAMIATMLRLEQAIAPVLETAYLAGIGH